jgi:hypothetical protein
VSISLRIIRSSRVAALTLCQAKALLPIIYSIVLGILETIRQCPSARMSGFADAGHRELVELQLLHQGKESDAVTHAQVSDSFPATGHPLCLVARYLLASAPDRWVRVCCRPVTCSGERNARAWKNGVILQRGRKSGYANANMRTEDRMPERHKVHAPHAKIIARGAHRFLSSRSSPCPRETVRVSHRLHKLDGGDQAGHENSHALRDRCFDLFGESGARLVPASVMGDIAPREVRRDISAPRRAYRNCSSCI